MSRELTRRECLQWLGTSAVMAARPLARVRAQAADKDKDRRMAWWREARFGMFIHWGLYAIPAGSWNGPRSPKSNGEWIMNDLQIPIADYETLVGRFDPVRYDPREWVRIAKDAGMKYLVITSKHHDGFALFDSKVSDYDAMATPYKRDLLRPLADECRRAGLRFCTYHSIMDWHHPDYLPRRAWDARPVDRSSLDRYVSYMKAQLKEIVTAYDPGVLWFDGEWENTWTHERGVNLHDYVRSLNPDIIINNRVDKGRQGMQGMTRAGDFKGDFGTPEQEIPASGLAGVDWESCMTMNNTWGFRTDDDKWKSSETLVRNLIDIASKGGNFLLNVGPTSGGLIPAPSVERLGAMAAWMKVNAAAIHGTTASPIGRPAWGRSTQKPGTVFLHVFDWPKDGALILALRNRVRSAKLLTSPATALNTTASEHGVTIRLPPSAPDAVASVIAVQIDGAPQPLSP